MTDPKGAALSQEVTSRVDILFPEGSRERARELLAQLTYKETERIQTAALKYSDGRLEFLERAVNLGNRDFRDLLMAVGLGSGDHRRWKPKPAGEPSEVDHERLLDLLQETVRNALSPLI